MIGSKNLLSIVLRGVGQVMFQNGAFSGALMLVGIAIGSPYLALMALIGNIVSNLTAVLCRFSCQDIANGLYGFNGTLVGIAIGVFIVNGWQSMLLLIPSAAISTIIAQLFSVVRISDYTAPFIISTWLVLGVAALFPSLRVRLPQPLPLRRLTLSRLCSSISDR